MTTERIRRVVIDVPMELAIPDKYHIDLEFNDDNSCLIMKETYNNLEEIQWKASERLAKSMAEQYNLKFELKRLDQNTISLRIEGSEQQVALSLIGEMEMLRKAYTPLPRARPIPPLPPFSPLGF